MPDYKEMYLHLARETEKAVRILIKAQQDCEEMYISGEEENVVLLGAPSSGAGGTGGDSGGGGTARESVLTC